MLFPDQNVPADGSLKERILRHDALAPRYTSYPSAPFFKPGFSESDYRKWLSVLPDKEAISLYIHIPFCSRLCYYCGCHTFIANRQAMIDSYCDALARELGMLAAALPARLPLRHLHFGGGSPTILSPSQFSWIMENVRRLFDFVPDCEIALEADPRHMSEARIAAYAKNGVNRISLGIQDINETVLKAVNRPQPLHLSCNTVWLCQEYGINHLNFDLMYGLPGQTEETISETIRTVLLLKPDRIAFFGYAHVPWMKKHMGVIGALPLPDGAERYAMYEAGSEIMKAAGYLPVGIDHFVRPSDSMAKALGNRRLRRNFQGYTTDTAETLIGVGASSIGRMREGYVQNVADLKQYATCIEHGCLPINKGLAINEDDHIQGEVISEIMCYLAVDLDQICAARKLDRGYFDNDLARLWPLVEDGLVVRDGMYIRVSHPHAARMAARAFDRRAAALETSRPLHSRVV